MADFSKELGVQELLAGQSVLSRPAEEFDNDPTVEAMWAVKTIEHARIYFDLLCSVDPQGLRLTRHDDKIYETFRKQFPELKLDMLNEDELKSEEGKKEWREFCEKFHDIVEDYNFGTLIRTDCTDEYSEKNSFIVPRVMFYALEIARNREGFNNSIRTKFRTSQSGS
ncbi:protein PBDC1 [Halyomorpha halys]|uniref:protein PBDC1 n=1 Tax=Halyomorpha halys TaxID=286706 RepID=UPI0006D4C8E7|nr:protein PBDC1 [Halyomorpha halys]